MITLCEHCYPKWKDVEVLTSPPLMPCASCEGFGPGRHLFRSDPRMCIQCGRGEGEGHYDDCPVGMGVVSA